MNTSRNWEYQLGRWAAAPSASEQERCENAVRAIRNAIARSDPLSRRRIKVFVQGSYRNRVNVRRESDVDIGVLCDETFFPSYPAGTTRETFGNSPADYTYGRFKDELGSALVAYFGRAAVQRGNKAFDIKENTYHVEADVAPFFEYRRYRQDGSYRCGVALRTDQGSRIHNYPERLLETWPIVPLHYENGVSKNDATRRSFKGTVRVLKSLRNEMEDAGWSAAKPVPGFLVECMTWNAPDSCFAHQSWSETIVSVLYYLWENTRVPESCSRWHEVNDIKFLFHSSQRWTHAQAHSFIDSAWSYLELPRS